MAVKYYWHDKGSILIDGVRYSDEIPAEAFAKLGEKTKLSYVKKGLIKNTPPDAQSVDLLEVRSKELVVAQGRIKELEAELEKKDSVKLKELKSELGRTKKALKEAGAALEGKVKEVASANEAELTALKNANTSLMSQIKDVTAERDALRKERNPLLDNELEDIGAGEV